MPADVNLQQMCTFVFFTQMISVNAVHVLNTAVPVIHVIIMPISVMFVAYTIREDTYCCFRSDVTLQAKRTMRCSWVYVEPV